MLLFFILISFGLSTFCCLPDVYSYQWNILTGFENSTNEAPVITANGLMVSDKEIGAVALNFTYTNEYGFNPNSKYQIRNIKDFNTGRDYYVLNEKFCYYYNFSAPFPQICANDSALDSSYTLGASWKVGVYFEREITNSTVDGGGMTETMTWRSMAADGSCAPLSKLVQVNSTSAPTTLSETHMFNYKFVGPRNIFKVPPGCKEKTQRPRVELASDFGHLEFLANIFF